MTHWPWWVGGMALAGIALGHWFLLRRTLAVSGRVTALVDRGLHGDRDGGAAKMSTQDMVDALRAATMDAFGDEDLEPEPEPEPVSAVITTPASLRQTPWTHFMFLVALVAGGATATLVTAGTITPHAGLNGELFQRTFEGIPGPLVLIFGGILVGFGTRMAGGCTSGHGLCGLSRLQPGSMLATVMFFGAGILASFVMEAMR